MWMKQAPHRPHTGRGYGDLWLPPGEREIELTEMFTEPDFDKAGRTRLNDLQFVILTLYHG